MRLAAEAQPLPAKRHHLTDGETVTAREVIDGLAARLGTARPRWSVPFFFIYAAAAAMEGVARLLRRRSPPPFTRYGVRLMASDCRYDNRKAERELGFRPSVSFQQGLATLGAHL